MEVSIGGKRWQVRYTQLPPNILGECDPPTAKGKQIRVSRNLKRRPRALLYTLVHEALHAEQFKQFAEEYVEDVADDITMLLWRQGFRLTEEA